MGDINIFPGKKIADLSEEDQARLLLAEIRQEHARRMGTLGIEL